MQERRSLGTKIDRALHDRFRTACEHLNFSQKDVIEALLRHFLETLTEQGQTELVRMKGRERLL